MRLCTNAMPVLWVSLLLAGGGISGDAKGQTADPPEQVSPPPIRSSNQPSQHILVRFYLDATSSMRGFAKPNSGREYASFVQRLEQVLAFGWSDGKSECYQAGGLIKKSSSGQCYLLAKQAGFYSLAGKEDVTRIDLVLAQPRQVGQIDVVVTDLYQDEVDLGGLFRALRTHVFGSGQVLGIVATRSEFDGSVHDIGMEKLTCRFTGSRPVYALVVGQRADVMRLMSEFGKPPVVSPADHLLALTPELLIVPLEWKTVERSAARGVAQDSGYVSVKGVSRSSYGVLRIREANEGTGLELKVALDPAPFHPRIRWSAVSAVPTRVSTWQFGGSGGRKALTAGVPMSSKAILGGQKRNEPRLRLDFAVSKMLPGFSYLADVRQPVPYDALLWPTFVKEWDSGLQGGRNGCAAFDGRKTQNLESFVYGAWRTLAEQTDTTLGPIYFYYKK